MGTREVLPLPALDYLNECFTYNPYSGMLRWKLRPRDHFVHYWGWRHQPFQGQVVTGRQVALDGVSYLVSRVAYYMGYQRVPVGVVDHKDRSRSNHTRRNLRDVSDKQNAWNRTVHRNNKAGLKGVSPKRGKWVAQICVHGTNRYVGIFDTPQAAHQAYCEAAKDAFGVFAPSSLLVTGA